MMGGKDCLPGLSLDPPIDSQENFLRQFLQYYPLPRVLGILMGLGV
jgi:hypothetical protein